MKLLLENWRKYVKESESSDVLSESTQILEGDNGWKNRLRDIVFGSNWQSREEYEASQDKKTAAEKMPGAVRPGRQSSRAARDPLAGKTYRVVSPKDFELSPAPRNVRDWLGDFLYVTPDQFPDDALVNYDTGELASELYDRMNKSNNKYIKIEMNN